MSAIRMKATDALVSPVRFAGITGNLLYAAVCAYLAAMSFGYMIGYSSPALFKMVADGTLGVGGASWFASIATIGAIMGCPLGGWAVEKYGRKRTLSLTAFPFIIGFALITLGADEKIIFFGRTLTGIGSGMVTVVAPMYVAEVSTKELRGMLGSGIQLAITIGILAVYSIGMVVGWKLLALIGLVCPILGLILTQRIPETPRHYLLHGKKAEAIHSLEWLRPWQVDTEEECRDIQEGLDPDDTLTWKEFMGAELLGPLKVSVGLLVLQQMTGINVVMFYTVSIFESAGLKGNQVYMATVVIGAVQVVSTVIACLMMDRAGRRPLLMISGLGMALTCFSFGYYYHVKTDLADDSMMWLPVFSLVVYIIAFSLGWGPIPMLVMSEVFPLKAKGRASAVSTFASWSSGFIITNQFHYWQALMGHDGVFWMFGACCLLSVLFVWRKVPETKGKSLEDIGLYFLGRAERGQ